MKLFLSVAIVLVALEFVVFAPAALGQRRHTAAECAAIAQFNSHARSEVRGMNPGELEPECSAAKPAPPPKEAPKSKPTKKRKNSK